MRSNLCSAAAAMVCLCFAAADAARSAEFYRRGRTLPVGASGAVVLPYNVIDVNNRLWKIREAGSYDIEGDAPPIDHGAILFVNGGNALNPNNRGRLDPMTGDLVLENIQANGITLTRRIFLDLPQGQTRYIDIVHNDTNQQQAVTLSIHTNLTFALQEAQFVADPADKGRQIGFVGKTPGGAVVQQYAFTGGRTTPKLDWNQGSTFFTITASLTIPPKSERAVLHVHQFARRAEDAVRIVSETKASTLLKNVPPALRQIVMNCPDLHDWAGDVALLRGGALQDVIELQNGDRLQGTLKDSSFTLETLFGPVDLPAASVLGIMNVGQLHQRQLLVTTEGQIFGGQLKKRSLEIALPSGQSTAVPLTQISRVGYHHRETDNGQWMLERPMLLLRGGERLFVRGLPKPLSITTRCGTISLPPDMLAAMFLDEEPSNPPHLLLSDGSTLSGLLNDPQLEVHLEGVEQPVRVPLTAIERLRLAKTIPQPSDRAPLIHVRGGDVLVGQLTEALKIETAFDERSVPANEVRLLTRENKDQSEVRVLLSKGDAVSGNLEQLELPVKLECGLTLRVPAALLAEYGRPPAEAAKEGK